MRSSSKKRTTAKESELTERIRELEENLAASVPKAELENVKSNLQLEINDLKMRLSVAEDKASQQNCQSSLLKDISAELSKLAAEGRLDEDGFEEREAEGLTAEIGQTGSSTGGPATGDSEESDAVDSEDEDSEEPTAESSVQSQITDRSRSAP